MASAVEKKELESGKYGVVCLQLPAPPGWKKKYLKEHPGRPVVSEFNWGTGETPRRSARISEKVKAMPTLESEPPKKRGRKSSASKKDNKESETVPEGTEETNDVQIEEAEKSEKENVEGEDGKVTVKENENENKDKTQDADSKYKPTSQEVNHGEDANMPTNIQVGEEDAEAVLEKLKGPEDGVEADASGVAPKETEDSEGATYRGKVEQSVAEADKGLRSGEQDKPCIVVTEERENEVEGEENVKHGRSTTESEGAIKVKLSANYNEGQINEINKKAEAANSEC